METDHFGQEIDLQTLGSKSPVQLPSTTQTAIKVAANTLGLESTPLVSYTGHHAQSLAPVCPTGMIFIPPIDGIAHAPGEITNWDKCISGANVVRHAIFRLALESSPGKLP